MGGGASSDMTACNMVSSWASSANAGGGFNASSWGGLAAFSSPAPVAGTSSCNQQQASTVGNLATAPQNGQLAGLGTPLDQIVIGDVTETPEPSTVLMLGAGLGFVAYVRRRRSSTAA